MITFKVDNLKTMNIDLGESAKFLRGEGFSDDDIFACKLVSCELITNVIRHGGDEAYFMGSATDKGINITVSADSLKGVDLKGDPPDIFAESGRGLYIVKSFITGDIERGESGEIKVYIKSTIK
jgi:anti-sigma regulatory factor (Ser/Thr protein kinase)